MYTIEQGIPIPTEDWSPVGKGITGPLGVRGPGYCGSSYPWDDLRVKDSFLVPTTKKRLELETRMRAAGKKLRREFVSRAVEGGIRIWRVT